MGRHHVWSVLLILLKTGHESDQDNVVVCYTVIQTLIGRLICTLKLLKPWLNQDLIPTRAHTGIPTPDTGP